METVQGGVPPYGVKETLVVNGKMVNVEWLRHLPDKTERKTSQVKNVHGTVPGIPEA